VDGTRSVSQWYGSIMLTREQRYGQLKLAPFVRLDAAHLIFDAFTETGSSVWALSYQKMTTDSISGVAGLRTSYDIPLSWGLLTLRDRLEYRRRFDGDYNQLLGYADLAGGPLYQLSGATLDSDTWTTSVGVRAKRGNIAIDAEYFTSESDGQSSEQGGRLTLSVHY
jgi:uncharacterized protein with beta-barrel porin domain